MSPLKFMLLAGVASIAIQAGNVQAHSDDYFDANPSPHGGQVRMSGAYHFELLIGEKEIVVYVTDHGNQPIPTANAVGKLEISSAGKKTMLDLTPGGANILTADSTGLIQPAPALTAQLSVAFPNKKPAKAKFTPFAKRKK